VPFLTHKRHLGLGFSKKMSSSMENCHVDVQNKLEVVRPATEVYAQEAIEALKAGKVIAVPTDTLYGFACDAWYGNFDSFRFTICLIPLNYDFLILKCPRKFKCYFFSCFIVHWTRRIEL
jgi:hypothetical protein